MPDSTLSSQHTPAFAFPPQRSAALSRCDRVDPDAYAATRNHLHGAVSGLSPYVTHGLVTVGEVLARVGMRRRLGWQDKFAFELGWREYFHHVWRLLGDGVWRTRRPLPAPTAAYRPTMPLDVLTASTGVPVIDTAVHQLYASGYLHNHQRMWLASYLVHLRKVDWRTAAPWMYAHLLDGDLASNTLSWQWVAGSWTGRPYLFNAGNVARHSERGWPGASNAGTIIDRPYPALARFATAAIDVGQEVHAPRSGVAAEPPVYTLPPPDVTRSQVLAPNPLILASARALIHPWHMHVENARPDQTVGLLITDFHAAYPWSARRWRWVLSAMGGAAHQILIGTAGQMVAAISAAVTQHSARPQTVATLNPFYRQVLERVPDCGPPPRAFPDPPCLHASFSSFWNDISKGPFPL